MERSHAPPRPGLGRRLRRRLASALRRKTVRVRVDQAVPAHATDARTLDLGCAHSRYSRYFPHRVGVDRFPGAGVTVVADAHDLPFRPGAFGFVLCTEMLEHAREPQRVVDEIHRSLVDDGRLFLTTRFLFPIHEAPHDYFRFTRYGLLHLFRDWGSAEVQADTRSFEAIAVLLRRMAFQADLRGGRATTLLLLLAARLLPLLDHLVVREYGDYARSSEVSGTQVSGYHVTAARRSAEEDR